MKILLIEDDEYAASILAKLLANHDYVVDTTSDGETGLKLAKEYNYNLILLDVLLPELDGISICRQLRNEGYEVPILILTALDKSTDRVMGLDAGADDYLIKPCDFSELIARVRALLRRGRELLPEVLTWENLKVDLKTTEVTYNQKRLHLTPKEYGLLELLLRNPQRIFSRSKILDFVWSVDEFPGEEAVTTQIKGLRRKLKAVGMSKDLIETVYGLGYRLKQEDNKAENQEPALIPHHPHLQAKTEVLTVVAKMREELKNSLTEQMELFERAIALLATGALDHTLREKAIAQAHRLIGSLGSLGLPEGSKVARQIEDLFQNTTAKDQSVALQINKLVELLWQIVVKGDGDTETRRYGETVNIFDRLPASPTLRVFASFPTPSTSVRQRILVIDDDAVLTEQLKIEAVAWGLQIKVVTNLIAARKEITDNLPEIILLDLTFADRTENGLKLLAELNEQKLKIPVVVLTAQNQLSLRLKVAHLGGYYFLQKPISSDRIFQTITTVLNQTRGVEAKVMVVDDDPEILDFLSDLLPAWGLRVTTLNNPRKFWEILEVFAPNLLILDVNMPYFNGLELCQVVRNDFRWGEIPILFLSALKDTETISRVFAAGADDYVTKPIIESELVSRLFNRLQRVQRRSRTDQIAIAN
ncbi:MAG: response regulator [Fischerella sp. CENA71]|nr:response regulator [Fischerella sp. CENA71]